MKPLVRYWNEQLGITTVEYALLLALIVVVAITAWTALGGTVSDTATAASTTIEAAGTPAP